MGYTEDTHIAAVVVTKNLVDVALYPSEENRTGGQEVVVLGEKNCSCW